MVRPTELEDKLDASGFLGALLAANSSASVKEILKQLPVVGENDYTFSAAHPEKGWQEGCLHWYPVGGDRGNAGRIKLAGSPENPLAERLVNGIEAVIELERQLELKRDASLPPPGSPREAVQRYFEIPPLDELPGWNRPIRGKSAQEYARKLAERIRLRLLRSKRPVEYTALIEDDGIGQLPSKMHETLLSLGSSDKPDKPYLIGVFGQGGSSAYAASEFSWIVSRRHVELVGDGADGVGWTLVKHIFPVGRRDDYFAYLAAHPDGRVPWFSHHLGSNIGFKNGTRIGHVNYNFGRSEPARELYQSLNHLLFNPVLPYELYTRPAPGRPDPMWGNGYRLSRLAEGKKDLDKRFEPQEVQRRGDQD
jgi:hypothetical protein